MDDLQRLKVKVTNGGNGDRHVWIYASRVNWRTCLLFTHADRHVVDISVPVCLFVIFFVCPQDFL